MKAVLRIGLVWALAGAAGFSREAPSPLERVPPASDKANPYEGDDRARRAGAKLYQRECAACHGRQAEGIGKAPGLVSRHVRDASPGALYWVLRNGSLYQGMPSFSHLPEPQRWQIVTYLKALE